MKLAESLFIEWIPNIDKAIRTTCSKCVVDIVERDGVNGINLLNVIFLQSMTFESIFLLCTSKLGSKYSTATRPSMELNT